MTSLQPRSPYTKEELAQLYPKGLQLQLVQVVSSLMSLEFLAFSWLFDDGASAVPELIRRTAAPAW